MPASFGNIERTAPASRPFLRTRPTAQPTSIRPTGWRPLTCCRHRLSAQSSPWATRGLTDAAARPRTDVCSPTCINARIDVLAVRLAAERPIEPTAVVNAGIAGNRIIPGGGNGSALLQRLDRDVLERAGATHVMFLQGMNDIGGGAAATQIIAAMQQIF